MFLLFALKMSSVKLANTRTALPVKLILLMQYSCISFTLTYLMISNKFWCMLRIVFCQSFVLLWGIFKCYFSSFWRIGWLNSVSFHILCSGKRKRRGEEKGIYSSHLLFLMEGSLWCLHRVVSSAICIKSLVTFFNTLWGFVSISLCTLCNHCLSQRTSAGTSTSKASYALVVLSFESTPYDVDTIVFNVISDLFPQGHT